MEEMMKRFYLTLLILLWSILAATEPGETAAGKCVTCHKEKNPGMYHQWRNSGHGRSNVTCYDCHQADKNDPDAFEHEGATIATLVTPFDCSQCHEKEAEQTMGSHHAKAGEILESADAFLAHVAGGHPAVIVGCESCHGSKVKLDPDSPNKLSKESWPNSGIGRLNPDGSKGSCNACHSRHSFSKEQARQPENCGKCHLGPDHPQKEIYEESKHGIAYRTFREDLNMNRDSWVVGVDYYQAPTCASCHMSATRKQEVTHDVGDRISWTLRPIVSNKLDNWEEKRSNMTDVCLGCHQKTFVDGHYYQYDALVELYNEKFAKPAKEINTMLHKKNLMERKAAFSNEVDWLFWELWHHEGRRARMGTAMMGPDYAWWHGIYDVAHNFYFQFLPAAREYDDHEINAYIDNLLENDEMHTWLNRSNEDLKADIRSGKLPQVYQNLFNK